MQLPRVVIAAVFFVIGLVIAVPPLVKWATESDASGPNKTAPSVSASPTRFPVAVTIGAVSCPARKVTIDVRNTSGDRTDLAVELDDGTPAVPVTLDGKASRATTVTLREDRRTEVRVTVHGVAVLSKYLKANCKKAAAAPTHKPSHAPSHKPTRKPDKLPHTGPDSGVLWARGATGAAALVTGAIILWYGGVWPRRREKIFAGKNAR
ncbi:hypothetical protein [Actinomadura atramentaria]|uniref:hypothetical protein n=1 Tax=Actinomadura atramentaria TaxID=1990 RepID=UPI00037F8ACE|nr:hypothetical protein [Actinomadura atramentaria]